MIEGIKALQRRVGTKPDGVVGPNTLYAINRALDEADKFKAKPKLSIVTPSNDISKRQSRRHITSIAVHCSATKEGKHYTAKDIDRWHRAQGWNEIGYNAVVLLDGTIEQGRDEDKVPSHAAGQNTNSIAICYVGGVDEHGKPKDTRTPEQKAALLRWLKAKKEQYPAAVIQGHRDYPGVKKACPSFDAKAEYAGL